MTYGNGLKVKYLYDSLDRIKEICYNTGSGGAYQTVYSYQYTADGQLASIKDHLSDRVTVYSYDPSGKLIGSYEYLSTENQSRHHSHQVYDELSRLTNVYHTVNYRVGSLDTAEDEIEVQYAYDSAGRLKESFYTAGGYYSGTTLTYDSFGRITNKLTSFDCMALSAYYVDADYTYVTVSSRGTTPLVATYTVTVSDSYGTTLGSTTYRYTYDANGNITDIKDASNVAVVQYTYDSLGQLVQEVNVPLDRRYVWTYDDAGNILSRTEYNKTTGALIGTQNYTYSTGTWSDLLTNVGATEIQYDSIGNPIQWGEPDGDIWYNGALLEWQGRQLQSFQAFNELDGDYMDADYVVYFKYNSDGIRTEKITDAGTHEYILNGSQIVGEWISDRSILIVYLYDENGTPIGMKMRNYTQAEGEFDEYFFEKNLQGDIIAVYNMDGEKLGSYTYDAWGNFTITLASTNTAAENEVVNSYNPFRYRGYYYDVETGLYYLQSRYYNPNWGRFINLDSVIAGVDGSIKGYNLFAYCFNNPVNLSDSIGNWPKWIETAANWVNDNIIQPVADFIDKTIDYLTPPSKEEHYNRNQNNIQFPEEYDETFFKDWDDSVSANCHQFSAPDRDNVKYVSPDGRYEAIYDVNNKLVTDPRDVGTYNFVSPNEDAFGHFVKDVIPWIQHGNSPDDSTEWWQRALSFIGIYA